MASQEFTVLYTHQKTKKAKIWQDGILKTNTGGSKATLYDDKGQSLESIFLKQREVKPGDDLESDRFLITVEEIKVDESNVKKEAFMLNTREMKKIYGLSLPYQPAGLKRKFTGFQGPRQVPKRTATPGDGASTTSYLTKEVRPASPQFYRTSPLFSTTHKTTAETPLSTDPESVVVGEFSEGRSKTVSFPPSTPVQLNQHTTHDGSEFCSTFDAGNIPSDSSKDRKSGDETAGESVVSRNIRSKAQILALLRSKSSPNFEELNTSDITKQLPCQQPSERAEGSDEQKLTDEHENQKTNSECVDPQRHNVSNTESYGSRWDIYLPQTSSSQICNGSDLEGSPKEPGDRLNLDLHHHYSQKDTDLSTASLRATEKRLTGDYDQLIIDDDRDGPAWGRKLDFQESSFYESDQPANSPDACHVERNECLLSDSSLKRDSEILPILDRSRCQEKPVTFGGSSCEGNGIAVKEMNNLEVVPLFPTDSASEGNDSGISEIVTGFTSQTGVENEDSNTCTVTAKSFLQVTFNLGSFDMTDPEIGFSSIPLDSEDWSKGALARVGELSAGSEGGTECSSLEVDSECLAALEAIDCKLKESALETIDCKFKESALEAIDDQMKESPRAQLCANTSIILGENEKNHRDSSLIDLNYSKMENRAKEGSRGTLNPETLVRKTNSDLSSRQKTNDLLVSDEEDYDRFIHNGRIDSICDGKVTRSEETKTVSHHLSLPSTTVDPNLPNNSPPSEDTLYQNSVLGISWDNDDDDDGSRMVVLPLASNRGGTSSILNITESHPGCHMLDMTSIPVSSTYPNSLVKEHFVSEEVEVVEEFEEMRNTGNSIFETQKLETLRDCMETGGASGNSSQLSEFAKSLSDLKFPIEPQTASNSLEILRQKKSNLKHRRGQTSDPDRSPEGASLLSYDEVATVQRISTQQSKQNRAKKPLVAVNYSEDVPKSFCMWQDSPESNPLTSQENQDEILIKPYKSFDALEPSLENDVPLPFLTKRINLEPKPVEFQGHQVKGSATSEVMVRKPCSPLRWTQYSNSVECENIPTTIYFSSQLPISYMPIHFEQSSDSELFPCGNLSFTRQDDFQVAPKFTMEPIDNAACYNLPRTEWTSGKTMKVLSPLQKVPTLWPDSPSSMSGNEISEMNRPEERLKARAVFDDTENSEHLFGMNKPSHAGNVSLPRFPSAQRVRTPLITLPPPEGSQSNIPYSNVIDSDPQETFGSPTLTLFEESEGLPMSHFEPEDRKSEITLSGKSLEESPRQLTQPAFTNVPTQSQQSKWLKYQITARCNLITPNSDDTKVTDDFSAESDSGMPSGNTTEWPRGARNKSPSDSVHLQMLKGVIHQQEQIFSSQDSVSGRKALSPASASKAEKTRKVLGQQAFYGRIVTGDAQEINVSELSFPSRKRIKCASLPKRQVCIPAVFSSPAHYKEVFTAALTEHLNILLFELSQRLHKAFSKVDISFYTSMKEETKKKLGNHVPLCRHNQPTKLVMVKKEGPNKGRLFYTCDSPKADQCNFFKWFDEATPTNLMQVESGPSLVLHDIKSIGTYLRCQKIPLYEECRLLIRKGYEFQRRQFGKSKKFGISDASLHSDSKRKLYLKLSRKENSSSYNKDDLWVISKTLDFELDTFIACSAFFGPSSNDELELIPLKGFYPSNWPCDVVVHALLVCNASSELTSLRNMQEYFCPSTLPLMQYLLTLSSPSEPTNKRINPRKFIPPAFSANITKSHSLLSSEAALQLASQVIQSFQLNPDQATALIQIAHRMASCESVAEPAEQYTLPITVIHGVFGAGKSYLLAVVVLFLVQLFEESERPTSPNPRSWKILISSSTNVAVDRVLLVLLSLGFEKFIRVGSIRKIAKPILPYSLHAGSGNENEQLKELHALMKEDLTAVERVYIRKSIEKHKLGTNRELLKQVRVVGATCAACPFPCMNNLKFPVVILDECSQITEPASLLPIARFECEKLVLVGDPKQLPPTIQGSDCAHDNGLEQTLFDRLCTMGHHAVLLRTQYRCHPAISAIANDLFYEGNLIDGISERDRSPLLDWLPTLCFYNVNGTEQIGRDNSFHNLAEAAFTLKLIQSLIASGIEASAIGVITLYKSQMNQLCNLFSAGHSDYPNIKAVQVSTVDAFQGAEKEVIVLSCVRTRQFGFIDSERRTNVALTRGKRHLLIVGNVACLKKNRLWGNVIQHCEGRANGLQHSSQYEAQLNHLLKCHLEKKAKEQEERSSQKEKSGDHFCPPKGMK
ncbi:protein ZGRF1 isoform X2 [Ornithorhynchus anatinus]|uniref:protein ZGRF1 isoform X2 n=1 Tax=Ornithorhynchus anatinus TaxID=9258 RepID=UPI0010A8ABC3|nr:protein ZGRF1 isoform X2 [Ornithorhynchus anatinus]